MTYGNHIKGLLLPVLAFCLIILLLSGCSSTPPVQPDSAINPPQEENQLVYPDFYDRYGGRDTLEPFNRSMFIVNKYATLYLVQPIAYIWGSLMPKYVIECFNRFTYNVAFPKRTFSALFQAEFKYAGLDTSRFFINIVLGLAGFYDPALDWFDMEKQDEDFGQTFAVWGIGEGPVLHLPFIGATNIRDGVGLIFDYAFDPKTYITGGQGFTMLNESTYKFREMEVFMTANDDPYELMKKLYALERFVKINNYDRRERMEAFIKESFKQDGEQHPPPDLDPLLQQIIIRGFKSQGGYVDTLRLGMVDIGDDHGSWWVDKSLWNSDFYNKGWVRHVEVIKSKARLPYKVWYQKKDDAPLAILLPGFGGHYTSIDGTALSKLLYDKGYTVVLMCSAMNWEFRNSAASADVPGYPPIDVPDVRNSIAAVIADLEGKGLKFPVRLLAGYSLGGMHALYIGELEKREPKLKFDRIIAINPPVNLVTAINVIDNLGLSWKKWPANDVFERAALAAGKYISIVRNQNTPYQEPEDEIGPLNEGGVPGPDEDDGDEVAVEKPVEKDGKKKDEKKIPAFEPLPITDREAQFLISFNFKITLSELLMDIVKGSPSLNCFRNNWTWGDRTNFYRETAQFTFNDYFKKIALKKFSEMEKRQVSMEEVEKNSSLRAIEDYLKNDPKIFLFHSSNDFLENNEERQWFKKTFGDRCVFYNVGGHLGDLSLIRLQDSFVQLAEDLLKKTEAAKKTDEAGKKAPDAGK